MPSTVTRTAMARNAPSTQPMISNSLGSTSLGTTSWASVDWLMLYFKSWMPG